MTVKPDNMQYAIGAYAVASLHKRPKQIWEIFAGQGKSRCIASAALYALGETACENVHFVFPTAHLMERDQQTYKVHFDCTDHQDHVHYHVDFAFETEKGDLIIVDEADYFIYDDPEAFYQFQLNKRVIGFTATASRKDIKGLERSVFECMKFHEATYWPSGVPKPYIDYSLRGIDVSR